MSNEQESNIIDENGNVDLNVLGLTNEEKSHLAIFVNLVIARKIQEAQDAIKAVHGSLQELTETLNQPKN